MTTLDKKQIRRSFDAAAATYEAAADWQKTVADQLLDYLAPYSLQGLAILDLGSGPGCLVQSIQQQYPHSRVLALDIAEAMLRQIRPTQPNPIELICSDAERLPLVDQCIDVVTSNMLLHWLSSLPNALREQHRVLQPQGLLLFSVVGADSLTTLKRAWRAIDRCYTHVHEFPTAAQVQQACRSVGFSILQFECRTLEKHYESVLDVMRHFKATGTRNAHYNRPKALMGKQSIRQLALQPINPITYEYFMVLCQKANP